MSLSSTLAFDLGQEVVIIYLGIFIGYLFGRSRFYSDSIAKKFSHFAVYVVFPPIILLNTLSVGEGQVTEMVNVLLFSMALHLILLGISALTLKTRTPLEKGSSVLTATFPNAVGYSFPIIAALQGIEAWVPATIFALGSRLIISTAGGAVALNYSKASGSWPRFFKNLSKLLTFPLFIATLVGLFLRGTIGSIETIHYPPVVFWNYLAIGCGLILVGRDCRTLTKSTILKSGLNRSSLIRFMFSPAIAVVACTLLQFPRLIAIPLIIQAWAPPAISTILYAEFFDLDTQTTSKDVTLLTFIALLLLPLEIFIVLWLYPV